MQILVKICLTGSLHKQREGQRVLSASADVEPGEYFHCIFRPRASCGKFLTVHNSGEHWPTAPDSGGQPTSSPPLNTFEHIFLCTAGPCPVQRPDHPLLLVDQTRRARSLRQRPDRILSSTTQRNFNAKAGWGWVYQGRITNSSRIRPVSTDKKCSFIFWLYIFEAPTERFPQFKGNNLIQLTHGSHGHHSFPHSQWSSSAQL